MSHTTLINSVRNRPSLGRDRGIQAVIRGFEDLKKRPGGYPVPRKMVRVKEILTKHFQDNRSESQRTCAIVFTNYRGAVKEIVKYLEQEAPLLRPTQFVGQGKDSDGAKGQSQPEQLQVSRAASSRIT